MKCKRGNLLDFIGLPPLLTCLCCIVVITADISPTRQCDIELTQTAGSVSLSDAVDYDLNVSPNITSVYPRRGGTGGGTKITITGEGFT